MATTKSDKRTMDVSKPGKTAPDTSGRPVIVSHKPVMQDPMVKNNDQPAEDAKPAQAHKIIQPLTEEGAIKPSDAAQPDQKPADQDSEAAEEAAVVDAVVDQASIKKKEADQDDEERKKQEQVAKLVADKKYFVPIGQVSKRRNKRASVAILILLILLIGVYLAIDAGLIPLTAVELPVDLIKN